MAEAIRPVAHSPRLVAQAGHVGPFRFVQRTGENRWLCVRTDSERGEKYLACKQGTSGHSERAQTVMFNHLPGPEAFLDPALNCPRMFQYQQHENIVTLTGVVKTVPMAGNPDQQEVENWAMWDWCAGGTLAQIFRTTPREKPNEYLSESLCWHVLVSLVRAVTYLHDGRRPNFNAPVDAPPEVRWINQSKDWISVLHRDIVPRNIAFQQRQGRETFGVCKLANFVNSISTGPFVDLSWTHGGPPGNFAMASQRGWEPLSMVEPPGYRPDWRNPNLRRDRTQGHCLADELWSIGSVLFTMMTKLELVSVCPRQGCDHVLKCSQQGCQVKAADRLGCRCDLGGCEHMPKEPCPHGMTASHDTRGLEVCREPSINIDTELSKVAYTRYLRDLVRTLLDCKHPGVIEHSALKPALAVEMVFRTWRRNTPQGQRFRDLEDDYKERIRAVLEYAARMRAADPENFGGLGAGGWSLSFR